MGKIKELNGELVMLVEVPSFLSVLEYPHVGEYDSRYVLRTTACEKKRGKFFELRSGKPVKKGENTLEWKIMTGNVLRYSDGKHILLSKKFCGGKILAINIAKSEFHPETMILRPIIDRMKDMRNT